MTFPSRTPEARRAEYLRNAQTRKAHYERSKDTIGYARKVVAQELGVSVEAVPLGVAEAKLIHLRLLRTVRERQRDELPALLKERYQAGQTTYEIADELGLDRNRVSAILKDEGVLGNRPMCKNGHPRTEANTAYTPQGWKRCRRCACDRSKEYERRQLAKRQASSDT